MYLKHLDLSKYWIWDIETDDLDATRLHCAVFINCGTGETLQPVGHNDVKHVIDRMGDQVLVGHNVLSFDAPTTNRLLGTNIKPSRLVDTLVLSYLYHPKIQGGHSLEAWGERLGFPKNLFDDFSKYSPELHERCLIDCQLNLKLFLMLTERMRKVGFSEQSCELEHKIRGVIDQQQQNGWFFDQVGARKLEARLRLEEQTLGSRIQSVFKPKLCSAGSYKYRVKADGTPFASYLRHLEQFEEVRHKVEVETYECFELRDFNIGSPQQRVERLLDAGWVPTKFTPKKNPQADEDSIVEFAKLSGIQEAGLIADWLVANGRANMLGTWLSNVTVDDSRIHGRVFSCGAASRRMTHSGPNTANVPGNEAKYGVECRELWTVDDPEVDCVVGYDHKSAQMRMFAHFLPDPNAGRKYWDTDFCKDPHQENADLIGIGRKPVKNVFYANLFGAYPPKLARTAGATGSKAELQERGEWIRRELYRTTPGLEQATRSAVSEFRSNPMHFMRCLDGGFVRCPEESAALNYRIQPAEAIVCKVATVLISERTNEIGLEQLKLGDIHDEGQHQTDKKNAHRLGELCCKAVKDAGEILNLRVPTAGDFKVGQSWAETH